jgi:hypothetical protein
LSYRRPRRSRAATQIPDRKPPYALPLAGSIPTDYAIREAGTMIDLLDELARKRRGAPGTLGRRCRDGA